MTVRNWLGVSLIITAWLAGAGWLMVANRPLHTDVPPPEHITRYPSGQWFVPANSSLGPPLSEVVAYVMNDGTVSHFPQGGPPFFWVKAFVLYDGTVCLNVKGKDDQIVGLRCVPKP